jgi:hypothetical protein
VTGITEYTIKYNGDNIIVLMDIKREERERNCRPFRAHNTGVKIDGLIFCTARYSSLYSPV